MHGFHHNTEKLLVPYQASKRVAARTVKCSADFYSKKSGPSDEFMRGCGRSSVSSDVGFPCPKLATRKDLRPMSNDKPLRSDHFPERRQTHLSKVSDDSRQALCARPTECAPGEVLWKHLRKCQGHETSRPSIVDCSVTRRDTTVVLILSPGFNHRSTWSEEVKGMMFTQATYYKRAFGRKQIDASCASGPPGVVRCPSTCRARRAVSRVIVRRVLSGRQLAWQSTIIQNGRISGAKQTSMLQRLDRLRRSKI
ncbi:hypothetical protein K449DRAFT_427988 [Hypoxylon sp. EC38]|nr:hypothetical protein K449DRAFT_427988 [Hypoxylon sp. EC38]